jgi:RHS repeat-associated protein
MGWQWEADPDSRLTRSTSDLGSWEFSYGDGDEVLRISRGDLGSSVLQPGVLGRASSITHPDGTTEQLRFDAEGRRIADGQFSYTWDWRGRLVRAEGIAGSFVGDRIDYVYDAAGRLLTRTHTRGSAFLSERLLVWEGQRLSAEVGRNYSGDAIWRYQYAPGGLGLDDAPQVRVETGLSDTTGGSTARAYAFARDELGSVIAVVTDDSVDGEAPATLLARYHYTPYGEVHIEHGPELRSIELDPEVDVCGGLTQAEPIEGETFPGSIVVDTSAALAGTCLDSGVGLSCWVEDEEQWKPCPSGLFEIANDGARPQLIIMPIDGWRAGARHRIMLKPLLEDAFGRLITLPQTDPAGVTIQIDVPVDGDTAPSYLRVFPFTFDSAAAAASTLSGAFPGGQPSLFQGLWTDPVTGLSYARRRWYDAATASWLSTDPAGSADSENLYAFVRLQPHRFTDPEGELADGVWDGISLGIGLWSLNQSLEQGDYGSAAWDGVGIVVDAAALLTPGVPGGAGVALKASRAARSMRKLIKAAQLVDQVGNVFQATSGAQDAFASGHYGLGTFYVGMGLLGARQISANPWRWKPDLRTAGFGGINGRLVYDGDVPSRGLSTPREQGRDVLGRFLPTHGGELPPGGARAARVRSRLEARFGSESVQQEQFLRLRSGEIAVDPLTGEGRRLDFVITSGLHGLYSVEVTSKTASKLAQLAKERRIRQLGGTFIRDRVTGELIDLAMVPTRVIRVR